MSDNVSGRKQKNILRRDTTCKQGTISSDSSVYKSSAEESVRNKGSKGASLYSSSEEYFEYSCDPCSTVGDHAEAHGYCTNCTEYLCDTCFRSHSRNKLSKHHVLLNKEDMPKKKVKHCDPCGTVNDEVESVGYCKDCNEYLCDNCYKSHSRSKLSKHHELVGAVSMSEECDHAITSSVTKMNIHIDVPGDVKGTKEYTFMRDINVKAETDAEDCYITGMTLVSNTKLVLCDKDNDCLKLVDIESNTIKDVLALPAAPFGITTISSDQIAVVVGDKYQVHIISVTRCLTLDRIIKTNGDCMDVKYTHGKLYVSLRNPVKIQILQPTGSIIKTIMPDSEVLRHCILPRYIAISPDESIIYVSDWKTNKVLSMDMNGNMIAMYQGELEMTFDITVSPGGAVYLCNREPNVVYKITSDLKEGAVILGPGDGLCSPQTICLNMDKQQLYISSGRIEAKHINFIKVFQLK